MFKALQLIFEPAKAWDVIARAERGVLGVFLLALLPTVLFATVLEGLGLWEWGNRPTSLEFASRQIVVVAPETIVRYELVQVVLYLILPFLAAGLFLRVLHSFHCRATFTQCFRLFAYTLGPVLLLLAVDGMPAVPTWVCRIIGVALSVKVLYLGLGRVIRPDPTIALGLYFIGALLLVAFCGLGHFFALRVLEAGLFDQVPVFGFGTP